MMHGSINHRRRKPAFVAHQQRACADGYPFWIGWCATALLITLAGLRVVVSFSPQLWWATDPRHDDVPVTGFGPASAAVTDWLCVVTLALAVLDCLLRGRRVLWLFIALWFVGGAFAAYHARIDAESMRIGGHWIGAIALGLAAAHLGSNLWQRRVIIAALVALIIPLGAQAIEQVTLGHHQTVKDYEEHREERLRQRGWEPDSVEAKQFEVRLYQNEASGRFGLANVFGSVAMALMLLAAGVAIAARRAPGRACLFAILTLGAISLFLSFSKGAIIAMLCAAIAVAVAWVMARRWKLGAWWWSTVAVVIVAAGVGGVVVRGLIGPPPSPEGELSLLFRWYYWQGAASMLTEHPFAGVGPGRFQEFYLVHKNPLNPEEVTDPHNVFVAFLSTLGVGGLAWTVLIVTMVWRLGWLGLNPRSPNASVDSASPGFAVPQSRLSKSRLVLALTTGLLIFGIEYTVFLYPMGWMGLLVAALASAVIALGVAAWIGKIETGANLPVDPRIGARSLGGLLIVSGFAGALWLLPSLGVWLIGLAGFIALTAWLSGRPELDVWPARLGLFTAAAAALLHAQIEMSMTNMMAAPLLFVVLGVAVAYGSTPLSRARGWAAFVAIGFAVAAMLITHLLPTLVQQRRLQTAATKYRAGYDPMREFETLRSGTPTNLQAVRYEAHDRIERSGRNPLSVVESARGPGVRLAELYHIEVGVAQRLFEKSGDDRYLRHALNAAEKALEHDPYNIRAHIDAADLAWQVGERVKARQHYRRALELNDLAYLIPHKQLQPGELAHINSRLITMSP